MRKSSQKLLQDVQGLPDEERLEFIERLLLSWDKPFDADAAEAWAEETDRRTAEVDAGTAELHTWDEVKRRARARLRGER